MRGGLVWFCAFHDGSCFNYTVVLTSCTICTQWRSKGPEPRAAPAGWLHVVDEMIIFGSNLKVLNLLSYFQIYFMRSNFFQFLCLEVLDWEAKKQDEQIDEMFKSKVWAKCNVLKYPSVCLQISFSTHLLERQFWPSPYIFLSRQSYFTDPGQSPFNKWNRWHLIAH